MLDIGRQLTVLTGAIAEEVHARERGRLIVDCAAAAAAAAAAASSRWLKDSAVVSWRHVSQS
jgi:hypothetical protein